MLEKVKRRLDAEELQDEKLEERLEEYIETVSDRLCIRLGVSSLPGVFQSICVDAVVKMHRRFFYEGVSSENDGGISVSYADDVLSEYAQEIEEYKENTGKKAVRFL